MNVSRLQSISLKSAVVVPVLVCCLIIGSFVGIPWLFADPYETSDHHTITHESTEAFDDVSTDDPTPIDELSPAAQTVVERGIAEYQTSDRESVSFDVKYCQEEMPVCDETERPDDFTYISTSSEDLFNVVETSDGVYILRTTDGTIGADTGFSLEAKYIVFLTIILPVAVVLGLLSFFSQFGFTTTGERTPNEKIVLALSLYGVLVTVVGIIDPFLTMYYGFSITHDFLLQGILLTWGVLFATVIHPLFDC